MHFEFLGDRFAIVDSPGSVGFSADGALAVAAADLAVVVVDPDTDRAILAEPALRQLEALGVPHLIFVNKIDQARGGIRDLLEALQPMSSSPLVARQIPIREGEKVTGFVDLALERAFKYRPGKPSEQIDIPADLADREKGDRFHMLEQLADHDDALLEQLLMDETPDQATIFADIARETKENLVVPVLFGSASNGFGVRRLMKALRHDAPAPEAAAERLGAKGGCAFVFKVSHGGNMGRLALARVFGGTLSEGTELKASSGETVRVGTLFAMQGEKPAKLGKAAVGDVVAIAKAEGVNAGEWLGAGGKAPELDLPASNYGLAIATRDRKDDVRLSTALHKLVEEDPSLDWEQDEALHETRLRGISDEHLKVDPGPAAAPLRSRRRRPSAGGRLQGIDPQAGHPARPPQEAVGRPRPVRRRRHRDQAARPRRGLQVRREDPRRRRAPAIYSRGRAGRPRRPGQGAARLPGGRRRGDPGRRQLPYGRQLGARLPDRRPDRHERGPGRRPSRTCSSRSTR